MAVRIPGNIGDSIEVPLSFVERTFVKQAGPGMALCVRAKKAFHICGDVKRLFDEAFRIIVSYYS